MSESSAYFEKQRDLLIQEIGISIESLIYNLDILNRSLSGSISVGKEFDNVGRLWSHFYDGVNQLKQRKEKEGTEKREPGGGADEDLRDTEINEEKAAEKSSPSDNEEKQSGSEIGLDKGHSEGKEQETD